MRGLVCFLRGRQLCVSSADIGGSLVEILTRGEAVGSELGFPREFLLGLEQVRARPFDLEFEDRNLLDADSRIDTVTRGARLARLSVRQDQGSAELGVGELDELVASMHALPLRDSKADQTTAYLRCDFDLCRVNNPRSALRCDPRAQYQKQQYSGGAREGS